MTAPRYQPLVHRMAVGTAATALLPIVMGAVVTTLGAGMAFLDWPSSDGQNMLLYPWLKDLAAGHTDKFVEHGHRLAGMLVGFWSIGLAVAGALAALSPWLLFKVLTTGKYRRGLWARLSGRQAGGDLVTPGRPTVWFHGVSVGEIHLLRQVVAAFRRRHPHWQCLVSTTTDTGFEEARTALLALRGRG